MAIGDGIKTCMICDAPLDAEGVNCTRVNAPYHHDGPSAYGYRDEAVEDPAAELPAEAPDGPNACYLCGGPLVEGECIAYHWHDGQHLRNRARMDPESRFGGIFHTRAECLNAPPLSFLIKDFLQREGVTAIAAPVRERKTLIALNICHALVTGEKLFDHFEVVQRPESVLYLCPEASLGPFTDRIRKIGLMEYAGRTFFYRTLSKAGHLKLDDDEFIDCLPGSVVVLDTAIRFLEGDENSSKDIRAFADTVFSLLKKGAESVLLLHHSPKDSGDIMTLENALRGSGDIGAFLACCWGTKLQDPTRPYESTSFFSNLKQRDFESKDFEVTCTPDCRMHIVGDPGTTLVSQAPRKNRPNKDGMEPAAIQLLKDNPKVSTREAAQLLKDAGIKRGKDWVLKKRYELMQDSGTLPGAAGEAG